MAKTAAAPTTTEGPRDFMTAGEAASFLGVSKATLYSYVSRGMVASVSMGPGQRSKGYRVADLLALKHRSAFRKDPDQAASEVIEFGTPILTTSISQITETEHSYRGWSSRELAAHYGFEQVAEFLWTGAVERSSLTDHPGRSTPPGRAGTGALGHTLAAAPSGESVPVLPPASAAWSEPVDTALATHVPPELPPVERLQAILPVLERRDSRAYGAKAQVLLPSAVQILLHLAYLSSGRQYAGSFASTLGTAWDADPAKLDALLVMVADHELNIATFTARCIASAGATLYQSVLGGLAALQGYKHLYGQVAEAKSFFVEVMREGDPGLVIRRTMRLRGVVPGFHNPYRRLYAGNDPRVDAIVALLEGSPGYDLLLDTLRAAEATTGEHPRVDFALAVAEPLLRLPDDAVFSLIAMGRTAGMIAHVLEQYASDRVIRPRARYVTGAV